jgi:hypothetical protein
LCGPNVLMGCTCALQHSEGVGHGDPRGSIGGLSPVQRQVWYKPQAKGEIPQTYIKCSCTHVMAATSYPTSPHHPIPASIHSHNHTSHPPTHSIHPQHSRVQPSPPTTHVTPTTGRPALDRPLPMPHARGGAGSPHAPEPRSVCATRRRRHSARVNGARYTKIYSDPINELRLRKRL